MSLNRFPSAPSIRSKRIYPVLAGLALLTAIVQFGILLITSQNNTPHVFGLAFFLLTPYLGLGVVSVTRLWTWKQRRLDVFEFPIWFTLSVYLQVLLNVWFQYSPTNILISPWLRDNIENTAIQTLFLFIVGIMFLWLGYAWFYHLLIQRNIRKTVTALRPRMKVILVIWLGSFFANFLVTLLGRQGYLTDGGTS